MALHCTGRSGGVSFAAAPEEVAVKVNLFAEEDLPKEVAHKLEQIEHKRFTRLPQLLR